MKFENYLQRAELISLQNFLKYGGETFIPTSDKKYSERLTEARRKAKNFFEEKFPDIDDFDRIYGYFDEQVSEYEEVFFRNRNYRRCKNRIPIQRKNGRTFLILQGL